MRTRNTFAKKKKIAKITYLRTCALITVLSISIFALFITIYLFTFLYGNVPWMELSTWKSYPNKEYSLPKMILKSKSTSSLNELVFISPFLNGTFTKVSHKRYDYPIYELNQVENGCKHYINYDITIPPGGWIIYSSCQKSYENPLGYNSIRAIGYPAYGKFRNFSIPVDVKDWYHAIHNHIQVPIKVT
ncbi:Uncharacterized protein cmbei_7002350 [Cryptosporidium meleagridis]